MKRFLFYILFCFLLPSCTTNNTDFVRPKAHKGFTWKVYEDAYCEIQVPHGWYEQRVSQGLTEMVRISPDNIDETGFNTGFTINTIICDTTVEWNAAISKAGDFFADIREKIDEPVESSIDKTDNLMTFIVEGDYYIESSLHPDELYHVRTIMKAFRNEKIIFIYSFGALSKDWESAWKYGKIILNPIIIQLPKD